MLQSILSYLDSQLRSVPEPDAKDIATILLSLAAFIVSIVGLVLSVIGLAHTIRSKKRDAERLATEEFAKCIDGLFDVSAQLDELPRNRNATLSIITETDSLDERKIISLDDTKTARIRLNTQSDVLLSRILFLLNRYAITPSDIQYSEIAVALSRAGRPGDSLRFHKKALRTAPSKYAYALAQRSFSIALINCGKIDKGHNIGIAAARAFDNLQANWRYDSARMRYSYIETFERLINAEIGFERRKKNVIHHDNLRQYINADMAAYNELIGCLDNPKLSILDGEQSANLKKGAEEIKNKYKNVFGSDFAWQEKL
jgi:hypothetical protein